MGFGLEGLDAATGSASPATVAARTVAWLLDTVTATVGDPSVPAAAGQDTGLSATATSSSGSPIATYRWDFGDGSPVQTTTTPTVDHRYRRPRPVTVGVEVTGQLGPGPSPPASSGRDRLASCGRAVGGYDTDHTRRPPASGW